MKYNKDVTSSRRRQRKAHFAAPSSERRIRMSATLSADLRKRFGIRAAPIHRDDEVTICSGRYAGKEGKVTHVRRGKYVINVDKVTVEKPNGATVNVGIHPSNVLITKLAADKNRDSLLERRSKAKQAHVKGEKYAAKAGVVD